MTVRTGIPIGGGISPASEPDRESWTRLFHEGSDSPYSHNLDTSTHGVLLMGFGLQGDDRLCIEMVVGCKDGTYFEEIKLCNCESLCLTPCNNVLFMPLPVRCRLRYTGGRLGLFNVFASPVPAAWFPILSAYAGRCQESCGTAPPVGALQCA